MYIVGPDLGGQVLSPDLGSQVLVLSSQVLGHDTCVLDYITEVQGCTLQRLSWQMHILCELKEFDTHPAFLCFLLSLLVLAHKLRESLLTPRLNQQPAFGDEQLRDVILAVRVAQTHAVNAGVLVLDVEQTVLVENLCTELVNCRLNVLVLTTQKQFHHHHHHHHCYQ